MVDRRSIDHDLARLEDLIGHDTDDADRVDAYWDALADAIRDAEAHANDGRRPPADLPEVEAFFPVDYNRDDIMAAFKSENATWADAATQVAEQEDHDRVDAPYGGDTQQ